jgi:hypothetical protein
VRGRRVLMLRALYIGSPEDAERTIAPLRQAAGEPLMDAFREMAYPETATLGPPPVPMATAMRIELFEELSDDVIALGLGANGLVAGVEFRHWGGAPARPSADAGPIGHRDAPFSVVVGAMAEDGSQGPALQAAVDKVGDRLARHSTGGSFLNFLADPARTPSAYTADDHRRLREVKAQYDPDNFFGSNLNIPPA